MASPGPVARGHRSLGSLLLAALGAAPAPAGAAAAAEGAEKTLVVSVRPGWLKEVQGIFLATCGDECEQLDYESRTGKLA